MFIDTIVICSCTAFIILLVPREQTAGLEGMGLLQEAMRFHLGEFGVIFIAGILALQLFHLHRRAVLRPVNVAYLFGDKWIYQTLYKVLALVMLFVGGLAAYTFVWDLGDVGIGLMTIFNLIVLYPLSGEALASLKEYQRMKADGTKRSGRKNKS